MKLRSNTMAGFGTRYTEPHPSLRRHGGTLGLARILVPIDFSAESRRALEYAGGFASQLGASITLLHVVDPIVYEADYGYGFVIRQVPNQKLLKKTKRRLRSLRKKLLAPKLQVEVQVKTGRAHSEIVQMASCGEMDLIIMGTRGNTNFESPGVTEKVIRNASCPVLAFRKQNSSSFGSDKSLVA